MQLAMLKQRLSLLSGQGVSLGSLTDILAQIYGDRIAVFAEYTESYDLVDRGQPRTYRDLEREVSQLAAALSGLGCQTGQRIILSTSNRFELLLLTLALIRSGAVAVPVNPKLKPVEFGHIIEVTGASAAIVDPVIGARFREAAPEGFRWLWTDETDKDLPPETKGTRLREGAAPDARLFATERLAPSETAILLCTSGTTGMPKAAALTSKGLLGTAGLLLAAPTGAPWLLRSHRDKIASGLPLTHVMGLAAHLAALCAGVPLVHCRRFRAPQMLGVLEETKANAFIGVPTMYADLEAHGAAERDLSHVQLWLSGADSMPPERARRFQRYGAVSRLGPIKVGSAAFADVYGMVELSGPMAIRLYPPTPLKKLQPPAIAVILPGFEARTISPEGTILGWGKVGELQVKGDSVLKRYEGNHKAGPDEEGWFSTGDLVSLWPGGVFSFAGRHRDRLKVAGFSVFPAEVEAILRGYDDVDDVVLVGVPDERLGEKPVALLKACQGKAVDPQDFLTWASEQVAGYRRPREAYLIDEIPLGNHGKIARQLATQMAIDLQG